MRSRLRPFATLPPLVALLLGALPPAASAALPALHPVQFAEGRYTYRLDFNDLATSAKLDRDAHALDDVVVGSHGAGAAERRFVAAAAGRTQASVMFKFDFSRSGHRPHRLDVTDYLFADNAGTGDSTTLATEWSTDGDVWWPIRDRVTVGSAQSSGPGVTTIDFAALGRPPRVVYYRVTYTAHTGAFATDTQQWTRSAPGDVNFVADFIVAPDDPADEVAYGFNDYPNSVSDYATFCERYIASGAKWIRLSPTWNSLQPSQGAWSSTQLGRLDYITQRFHAAGVRIVWILAYTAPWASWQPASPDATRHAPADWAQWENYVATLVTRYGHIVRHWEIWNEPDHPSFWMGTMSEFVTLTQRAHAVIKQHDPALVVLMGGLAAFDGSQENTFEPGTFLDRYLAAGGGAYFDVFNYHSYSDSAVERRKYAGLLRLMKTHGLDDRPVWITEAGHSTGDGATAEDYKADRLDQYFQLFNDWMPRVTHVFLFTFRKLNASEVGDYQANFGLVQAGSMAATKSWHHHHARAGAATDFAAQAGHPTYAANYHTLYHMRATSGDGGHVVDVDDDRLIPATRFMYFRVQDNWLAQKNGGLDPRVRVEVTYRDEGSAYWELQYDSDSAVYAAIPVARAGAGEWRTHTFVLDDAHFANRQANAADFRLAAGAEPLTIRRVVVRKEPRVARAILGAVNQVKLMEQVMTTSTGSQAYTVVETKGGLSCRTIAANNRYFYFRVSDGFARAGDTVLSISITFWDAGADNLRLQYNALGSSFKSVYIQKTDTSAWRTVTVPVADAHFTNAQTQSADFRIGNGGDGGTESVREVVVLLGAVDYAAWAGLNHVGTDTGFASDPDHDGLPNLFEYALGARPDIADAGTFAPRTEIVSHGGQTFLSLVVPRDPATIDVPLTVEVSADLVEWFSGSAHTTILDDTPHRLHVRDNTPLGVASRRFIRLRAAPAM